MYTLYGREASGSTVVEAMLALSGAAWRLVPVGRDEAREAPYLALNPLGQVPTLVLPGGGGVMTESAAICLHLADAHPAMDLAPAIGHPDRPAYLRWMLFLAAAIYPTDLRAYYPERYTADPDGGPAVKEEALARMAREFAVYAQGLGNGPFILGPRICAVDLYAAMLCSWDPDMAALFRRHGNLGAMYARVKAVDGVGEVWGRNGM